MILSMKFKLQVFLLLLLLAPLFSQSYDYEPFFTVRVTDNENTVFLLSNVKYFDSNRELKYFFWIRRGAELGTATYQLDFKKIHRINFTGEYDEVIPTYTQALITLTSGEVFDVLINTTGYIGGIDGDFGVYGDIYMNYNIIRSIEFIHDGTYGECPFCGAIFYDSDLDKCKFDGTALIPQHHSD